MKKILNSNPNAEALDAIGGRKFLLSFMSAIACFVLIWFSKLTPEIFRDCVLGLVGVYIAGNAWQKVKTANAESNQ